MDIGYFYLVIGHSPLNPPHFLKSVAQLRQEHLKARKDIIMFSRHEDKTRGAHKMYTTEKNSMNLEFSRVAMSRRQAESLM